MNPDFRNKTDLLFFSNRLDLDLDNYKDLFNEGPSNDLHVLDRFYKASEIFWENSAEIWNYRFTILLGLENPALTKALEKNVNKKAFTLLRKKQVISPWDNSFIQYLELCKVKWGRKESLSQIRNYLLELPDSIKPENVLLIIEKFIPYVFKNINEYISYLCKRIIYSTRNLIILKELKERGFVYDCELLKEQLDLTLKNVSSVKMGRAFCALLNEKEVALHLKEQLSPSINKKVINIIAQLSFKEMEDNNYFIFKTITEMDSTLSESLLDIFATKLFTRGNSHLTSNCNKLAKLSKNATAFNSKVIFRYLISLDKLNYIKALTIHFPEYQDLIPFL